MLFGQVSYSQVSAGFSANIMANCAPLAVQFQDMSTGNPTAWRWELGNGTISFFQNPSTVYDLPGQYTIKLTVSNANGTDSVVKLNYITVYATPGPNFTASDTIGCFPFNIKFTNLTPVTDSANNQYQWNWDFGDGNTSTLRDPVHIYGNAGNFTVNLQVTTGKGCVQTMAKSQYIRIAAGVKAGFSDTAGRNCSAPVQVQFINASSGPGTLSYKWDFGDGLFSSQKDPVHVYAANGEYTATLVSTSSSGCQDTLQKINLINIGNEITRFASPDSVCSGLGFWVNNTSSPAPLSVRWDFGDGTQSTSPAPIQTYSSPGVYTIRMVDSFQNCTDSATRLIRVRLRPAVSFTSGRRYSCGIPFITQFNSNAAAGTTCQWDFGDGSSGTGPNPAHTYNSFGSFTVSLVITGANICPDTLTESGYITLQPPTTTITGLPVRGCLPLTITPGATVLVADTVTYYHWDFGDGTSSSLAAPVKTYTVAGDYTVKLVIRTAGGCMDSIVLPNAVLASQKPQAAFAADPREACRSKLIRFTNLTTPASDQWAWNFGDGGISGSYSPEHRFGDTGYFKITLVAWNQGCADTLTLDSFVHIEPPLARFIVGFDCADKYDRTFINKSIGADSFQWDLGDGTTSTDLRPVHRYAQVGNYLVKLIVTNGSCADTTSQSVIIADEHPDFQAVATVVCKGNPTSFVLSGMNPAYTAGIVWNFGDGATSFTAGNVSHTYTRTGWDTVSLILTDANGCVDSVIKKGYIHVSGPKADFIVQQSACIRGPVVFADRSAADSANAIVQWTWEYGDGTVSNYVSPPFTHVYTSGGSYTVGLRITDSEGCMDSLEKEQAILISNPRAAFAASDTNTCRGQTILFSNSSTGFGLHYKWDFGNGSGSASASPAYAYPSVGDYRVNLLITDSLGCQDSLSQSVNISIPVAAFDLSDSAGSCPPLQVRFTNRSQNYISLRWDFGDGSNSTLENPIHFYNFPGTYFAKALIVGPGGCQDSAIRKIVIRGPQGSFSYSPFSGCRPLTVQLHASVQHKTSLIWDFNDGNTNSTSDSVINYIYKTPGEFLPKMILIDSNGCRVGYVGPDTITVIGVSSMAGLDNWKICDSGFVQFTDLSVANDYITKEVWDFGDSSTSLLSNPRHFYDQNGLFTVRHFVTTSEGCIDSISLVDTIKVYKSPGAAIEGDSAACAPGLFSFHGVTSSGDSSLLSWNWDFGDGQTGNGPDPAAQAYPVPGTYPVQLRVTYANYCSSTATRNINSWPLPNTFAGNDTVYCEGHPIQLQATHADSYVWSQAPAASCTACADPWIDPMTDTTYIVVGSSLKGCTRKDSVNVRVRHPFSLQVSPGATICPGQSTMLVASGADQYRWIPAIGLGDSSSPETRASPVQSTVYEVIGSDNDHCFADSSQVSVIVDPFPQIFVGHDTTVITGSILQLNTAASPDVDKWSWTPGTGLSCSDCPDPQVTVTNTTTYTESVSNAAGCTSASSITIYATCNGTNWFVPNTFSPNGDGMNDVFYVRGKGLNTVQSMLIFNRWGRVVFEKKNFAPNDPSAGWDGTFNGQKAPMDVYVYLIEIVCDNSMVVPYRGNVALIR